MFGPFHLSMNFAHLLSKIENINLSLVCYPFSKTLVFVVQLGVHKRAQRPNAQETKPESVSGDCRPRSPSSEGAGWASACRIHPRPQVSGCVVWQCSIVVVVLCGSVPSYMNDYFVLHLTIYCPPLFPTRTLLDQKNTVPASMRIAQLNRGHSCPFLAAV